jgi:hypothetical protein
MRDAWTLLIGVLLFAGCGRQAVSPNSSKLDFSQYETVKECLCDQTNADWHLQKQYLLAVLYFPYATNSCVQYYVNESGHEVDFAGNDFGVYDSHDKQLSETDFNNLKSAMKKLPAEYISPPVKRLVVVSSRAGTNWITYAYDRKSLSPAMQKISALIGAQIEIKDSQ